MEILKLEPGHSGGKNGFWHWLGGFLNKVIITGSTGFIGSDVVSRLLESGVLAENLYLLVRKTPKEDSLLFQRLKSYGLETNFIKLNYVDYSLSDLDVLQGSLNAFKKEDWTFVHLAAVIHAGKLSEREQEKINFDATKVIYNWCAENAKHFIFTSSVVSFGATFSPVVRSENSFNDFSWINNFFPYFTTKRKAHIWLKENTKLSTTLLCPGIVHGALESTKDTRGHLKALASGKLKFAPGGGGNIVGLDRVSAEITKSTLEQSPERFREVLLVDENISYAEYFQFYANEARKDRAQKIIKLPKLLGYVAMFLIVILKQVGIKSAALGAVAQASLYLYFKSNHDLENSKGSKDSIKDAINT